MARSDKPDKVVLSSGDPALATSVKQTDEEKKAAGKSELSTPTDRSAGRVSANTPNAVQQATAAKANSLDEDTRAAILGTATSAARPAPARVPGEDVGSETYEASARATGVALPARTRFDGNDAADRMRTVTAPEKTPEGTYKSGRRETGFDGAVVTAGLDKDALGKASDEVPDEADVAAESGQVEPTDEKAAGESK